MEAEMPTAPGRASAQPGSIAVPYVPEEDPTRPWSPYTRMPPAAQGVPEWPGTREFPDEVTNITTCEERKIAIDAEEVSRLRDRCRIDLGPHADNGGSDLRYTVIPGYEPSTSKGDMFWDFLPGYMSAKTTEWDVLARNIKGNYQSKTKGCFWDDGGGFMYRAVLHALALLASAPKIDQLGSTNEELYAGLRKAVRNGDLPLYLSEWGFDGRSVLMVDEQGRVAIGIDSEPAWVAITTAEISLSTFTRGFAAAADYYFWWAWRLHSAWRETGVELARIAGITCARLALAAVADIAAVIAHEWVHLQGYWPGHCRGIPPANATDLTALAGGLAAGESVVAAFTWLGGLAVLGAFTEEGYHCRHDIIQYGTVAHLMASFGLPFPPQWDFAVTNETETEQLRQLIDLPIDDQQYDIAWSAIDFVNFGYNLLNGRDSIPHSGSHSWYDTVWGFSAVLSSDGCSSVEFEVTANWNIGGGQPTRFRWTVPDACRDGGSGQVHRAVYG